MSQELTCRKPGCGWIGSITECMEYENDRISGTGKGYRFTFYCPGCGWGIHEQNEPVSVEHESE